MATHARIDDRAGGGRVPLRLLGLVLSGVLALYLAFGWPWS